MSSVQNFFTSRDNNTDPATYVGQLDRLWYNPVTNSIFVSNGSTPGGVPVALATNANITANIVTLNTITSSSGNIVVTGNLTISGNISPATDVKIGGVRAGPGANISNDGLLTIDTAGLPLSFGDFTANNNILTLVNVDQDMILATKGSAEVQLVGNIGFYKTDGFPPNIANRYFYATDDGTVHSKYLDIQSFGETGISAPFNVTIDASGNYRAPAVLTGTIAQFTGNSGQRSFIVQDNYGVDGITGQTGGEYTFRTGRGTVDTPSTVQTNDRLASVVAAGWASNGYGGQASGFYRIVANENFTPTARGGRLEMWVVPNGTITETKIVNIDSTGANITGNVVTTGNVSAGNVSATTFTGNVVGNVTGTVANANSSTNLDSARSFRVGQVAIPAQTFPKNTPTLTANVTVTGLTTSHKVLVTPAGEQTVGTWVTAAFPAAANTMSVQIQNVNDGGVTTVGFNLTYWAWI